jgi:hypothetical protein
MTNESMMVFDIVERRKTTTLEFSHDTTHFLRKVIEWLEAHNRKVTPSSLKSTACLLGPGWLGVDTFVINIYQEAGNVRDYEQFLKVIRYKSIEER